jgi:hypothetical protein
VDKRTAERLARKIERDDPRCSAASINRWGSGGYSLTVTDSRTGYRFQVYSPQDWEERKAEAL